MFPLSFCFIMKRGANLLRIKLGYQIVCGPYSFHKYYYFFFDSFQNMPSDPPLCFLGRSFSKRKIQRFPLFLSSVTFPPPPPVGPDFLHSLFHSLTFASRVDRRLLKRNSPLLWASSVMSPYPSVIMIMGAVRAR